MMLYRFAALTSLALALSPLSALAQTDAPVVPAPAFLNPAPLTGHQVWVHWMKVFPLELKAILPYFPPDVGAEAFGANYPLLQEMGLEDRTRESWIATDLRAGKAAGVDGFDVDVFTGDAAGEAAVADKVGGIQIAPCLDLSGVPAEKIEQVAYDCIVANCVKMAPYHSTAHVGGAQLFFTYGTGMIPAEGWTRVRTRVAEAGYKTYFVAAVEAKGDLGVETKFPRDVIASYAPLFEAGYSFGSTGQWWDRTAATYRELERPFAGGGMPGYDRETPNGGYRDAQATALYRAEWHRHMDTRTPWAVLSTWNDLAENTALMPTADWNLTRCEITRWFSARFKGLAPPWHEARLYVTTPKAVYQGAAYPAEGLVLNGSASPVRVTVQLLDGARQSVGRPITEVVAPNSDGAATARVYLAGFPAGRFLRARVTLSRDGESIASVLSAPILVLDADTQPGFRTTYYSVPARQALPGAVHARLQGLPTANRTAQITTIPPAKAAVKFAEVLQNTTLAHNFFAQTPFTATVPRRDGSGLIRGGSAWGFYVGRVTDQSLSVGYSDPAYVAPQGDTSLWEKFNFDEGAGAVAHDASAYGKTGTLHDAQWVTPGYGGKGACLRLDGKTAFLDLRLYHTPTGPLSIRFEVRPAVLGGFLYADNSGLWTEMDAQGHVSFVRNTPKGFVRATGGTPLRVGEWARLEFTYNGRKSCVFVNGLLDAEADCPPGQPVGGQVFGFNPYGGGYFSGEVDDLEVRALPRAGQR